MLPPSFKYFFYWILLEHVLPFIQPSLLYLINFTTPSAFLLSFSCRCLESIGITTGLTSIAPRSRFWSYFTMAATDLSTNIFIHSFFYICVHIKFAAIYKYEFISYALVFLEFWRKCLWLIYLFVFPSVFISNISMPVPELSIVGCPLSSSLYVLYKISLYLFMMC